MQHVCTHTRKHTHTHARTPTHTHARTLTWISFVIPLLTVEYVLLETQPFRPSL